MPRSKSAASLSPFLPPNGSYTGSDKWTERDHAADGARRGFPVFRLPANAKKPPPEGFFKVATNDPAKAYEMWTCPVSDDPLTDNIGISCDNLLVLDVDTKAVPAHMET